MKAVVLYEHGGQEQLIYETNYRDPEIGPGDVLVRVKASSLNYHDVFTRRGMPGIKLNLPVIPGLDVAGEVAEIGPEVEGWSVGDRVLVDPINRVEGGLQGETCDGGMAELCRVRAHQLIPIPEGVSFAQAASLPVAYGTAHRMMFENGNVKAGEKMLVLGLRRRWHLLCLARQEDGDGSHCLCRLARQTRPSQRDGVGPCPQLQ